MSENARGVIAGLIFTIVFVTAGVFAVTNAEAAPVEKTQEDWFIPFGQWTEWHKITETSCTVIDCWVKGCWDWFCTHYSTFNVTLRAYNEVSEGRYCRLGGLVYRRYTRWECRF